MPAVTVGIGVLLIVLGIASYFGTDRVSMTALIPACFGLPLWVLGMLAFKEKFLKHAMHGAAALGLIGFLGVVIVLIVRSANEKPVAIISQAIMAILCGVFIALCVRSFIVTRRNRAKQALANPGEPRVPGSW